MTRRPHLAPRTAPRRLATVVASSALLLLAACTAHAPLKALPDKPADSLAFARTVSNQAVTVHSERFHQLILH